MHDFVEMMRRRTSDLDSTEVCSDECMCQKHWPTNAVQYMQALQQMTRTATFDRSMLRQCGGS